MAHDLVPVLQIRLKRFGIPINEPSNVLCDNNVVVNNTSISESTLFKMHDSINRLIVCKFDEAGIMRVAKEDIGMNLADALTKLVPYLRKQRLLDRYSGIINLNFKSLLD